MDGAFREPARAGWAQAEMKRIRSASRVARDTVISALLAALRVMDGAEHPHLQQRGRCGQGSPPGSPATPPPTAKLQRAHARSHKDTHTHTQTRTHTASPLPETSHYGHTRDGLIPSLRTRRPTHLALPHTHVGGGLSSPNTLAADPSPGTHGNKTSLSADYTLHICPPQLPLACTHTHTSRQTVPPRPQHGFPEVSWTLKKRMRPL